MSQIYQSGVEVKIGDRVRCKDDEGKILALQEDLTKWGVPLDEAAGKVMIEFKKMRLVCEDTAMNEDLEFVERAPS